MPVFSTENVSVLLLIAVKLMTLLVLPIKFNWCMKKKLFSLK